MPTRLLPDHPSFKHLQKQAKRLHAGVIAGATEALALMREFHPRVEDKMRRCSLADAQFAMARSYGFASWAKLKQHLTEIAPFVWNLPPVEDPASRTDIFIRLAVLTYSRWDRANTDRASKLLQDHPELGTSSVYFAAAAGNVSAVGEFVSADPSLVNTRGGPLQWEPLLYACYSRVPAIDATYSTLEVARLLLSRGADPNAGVLISGRYAFTALTGAFGRGEDWNNQLPHPECEALARLLLEAGADPNDAQTLYNRHFHENNDHLRLLLAYGLGSDKGGRWLKRLRDENATPATMLQQQLCWAAIHDFRERLRLLGAHGVDVNAPCPRSGRTPYQEAIRAGHRAAAEDLVELGAVRLQLDPLESFALASSAGRREEARALLEDDPTLLERLGDRGRMEMLHRAVDAKQHEGIRLILELGVDINEMIPGTGFDRAVLHNAAAWGGTEMVKFLISQGADPRLRDLTYRSTPIGWAFYHDQPDVVAYLLAFASIFDAVRCDGVEQAAALLDENPSSADARDDEGVPLVFYLHPRLKRVEAMIRTLVAHGADVNARNSDGETALDRALVRGWIDLAEVLRKHGFRSAAELSPGRLG